MFIEKYKWARVSENNYEVSTKGDKRFSALVAKFINGRTIEEVYQLDIKGYNIFSDEWKFGKGKPPLNIKTKNLELLKIIDEIGTKFK